MLEPIRLLWLCVSFHRVGNNHRKRAGKDLQLSWRCFFFFFFLNWFVLRKLGERLRIHWSDRALSARLSRLHTAKLNCSHVWRVFSGYTPALSHCRTQAHSEPIPIEMREKKFRIVRFSIIIEIHGSKSNFNVLTWKPNPYLAIKKVMVEHVVVTELILAVELSISETWGKKKKKALKIKQSCNF